MRIIDQAERNT